MLSQLKVGQLSLSLPYVEGMHGTTIAESMTTIAESMTAAALVHDFVPTCFSQPREPLC